MSGTETDALVTQFYTLWCCPDYSFQSYKTKLVKVPASLTGEDGTSSLGQELIAHTVPL